MVQRSYKTRHCPTVVLDDTVPDLLASGSLSSVDASAVSSLAAPMVFIRLPCGPW